MYILSLLPYAIGRKSQVLSKLSGKGPHYSMNARKKESLGLPKSPFAVITTN